jgi:hypothetical protein
MTRTTERHTDSSMVVEAKAITRLKNEHGIAP